VIGGFYDGIVLRYKSGTITNNGTIDASFSYGFGVRCFGNLDNTVINNGVIIGGKGARLDYAIQFGGGNDLLVLDPNASFTGTVDGGAGVNTLEFDAGAGANPVSGLGTQFINFERIVVEEDANWTLAGVNTFGAAERLTDSGTLTVAGTTTWDGIVTGTGTITLAGGKDIFGAGAALSIADLIVSGSSVDVTLATNLADHGASTIEGGQINLGGDRLTLVGAASFGVSGYGPLVRNGTVSTLAATSLTNLTLDIGTRWNNWGTLTDQGRLTLRDVGDGPGAVFVNRVGATLDLTGAGVIVRGGTGPGSLVNEGNLVETGNGAIIGGITNTGTIDVASGSLKIIGAITDVGGQLEIGAGASLELSLSPGQAQTISFEGSNGTLRLDAPGGLGTRVEGFATGDHVDLRGLAFGGTETLAFSENSAGTQGTLTITDGAQSLKLILFGQYAASDFKLTADGGGGTMVTFATPPNAATVLAKGHG